MNNRELLELAAKAARYDVFWVDHEWVGGRDHIKQMLPEEYQHFIIGHNKKWNPIEDDGDAFRLAVKIGIVVQSKCYDDYDTLFAAAHKYNDYGMEVASVRVPYSDDPYSATRLAIVQIAAILGKQMNDH